MVVAKDIILNHDDKTADVVLYADTKAEVKDNIDEMNVKGWIKGFKVAMGSQVVTMAGETAFRKSDGTWNWLDFE